MKDDFNAELAVQHEISNVLGHTFEEMLIRHYKLIEFTTAFVMSNMSEDFFSDGTIFSQSFKYIATLFEESFGNSINKLNEAELYDKDVAFWLGYIVGEIIQTDATNKRYLNKHTIKWLYNGYETLHTQDCMYVLTLLKEDYVDIVEMMSEVE